MEAGIVWETIPEEAATGKPATETALRHRSPAQQAAPKPEGNHQPISAPKPGRQKGKVSKEKKADTQAEGQAHCHHYGGCAGAVRAQQLQRCGSSVRRRRRSRTRKTAIKVDVSSLLNSGTRIDDVFTFVVGAVDEDETRTDALMVATMDTKDKTINVMNIPRDTCMQQHGNRREQEDLTQPTAWIPAARGGNIEQTSKGKSRRLMGFQPDKYVIVNFDGIAAIVDAIGGVDYDVPFDMKYDDPSQNCTST